MRMNGRHQFEYRFVHMAPMVTLLVKIDLRCSYGINSVEASRKPVLILSAAAVCIKEKALRIIAP